MYRIAIIDDDTDCMNLLCDYVNRYQDENNMHIGIDKFTSGMQLLIEYKQFYDVIFLDIQIPHMNGMDVAKSIRDLDPNVIIIFVTNTPQFAVKGYEVNAFDYMIKPVDYFLFSTRLRAAIGTIDSAKEYGIIVPWKDGNRRIKAKDVIFIEVRDHLIHVHTRDEEYIMTGILKELEDRLKLYNFIKCNKSYLINVRHIKSIRSDVVELNYNHILRVSRARRKSVQEAFIEYYNNQF